MPSSWLPHWSASLFSPFSPPLSLVSLYPSWKSPHLLDFLCMPPIIPPPLSLCVLHALGSQISDCGCERSIRSMSRLFVEGFPQTSRSRWRGSLSCSAGPVCCSALAIWALLCVTSSSLSSPTWTPSGRITWAGRYSRRWRGSSLRTPWKGQQGRRVSGCWLVWIRMTMRRAGNCWSTARHKTGQTGKHRGPERFRFHLGPSAVMDEDVLPFYFIVHWVLVTQWDGDPAGGVAIKPASHFVGHWPFLKDTDRKFLTIQRKDLHLWILLTLPQVECELISKHGANCSLNPWIWLESKKKKSWCNKCIIGIQRRVCKITTLKSDKKQ